MRRFFVRALAAIGGLVVLSALGAAGTAAYFWWTKPRVPAVAVLTLDLDRGLPEQRDTGPLSLLGRSDAMLDAQLRSSLQAVIGRATASLAADLGTTLEQLIRDLVARAVTEEITRVHDEVIRARGGTPPDAP